MRVDLQINNANIDLFDVTDFPIALTFSLFDIQEFDKRQSTYSKTAQVPATKNNNEAFGYQYSANIETSSTRQFDFVLYANGLVQSSGKARVTAIGALANPSYYEITLYSGITNWAEDIKQKQLNTYDLGNATHEIGSVDNTIYPDRNYLYAPFNRGQWSKVDSVNEEDVSASIFIKAFTDKIFEGLGYSVSSSFMDSSYFRRLVYQVFGDGAILTDEQREAREFQASKSTQQDVTKEGPFAIEEVLVFDTVDSEGSDANYSVADNAFIVQKSGYYQFRVKTVLDVTPTSTNQATGNYLMTLRKNGNDVSECKTNADNNKIVKLNLGVTSSTTTLWNSKLLYLEPGDEIDTKATIFTTGKTFGDVDFAWTIECLFKTQFIPDKIGRGNIYDLAGIVRNEALAFNLLKDLQIMFNLMIETNEQKKEILIEPRDDYFLGKGSAIDWTDKIDYSQEIIDTYLSEDTPRIWDFKYKKDPNDKRLEFNNKGREVPYYDAEHELPDYFLNDKKDVQLTLFAATWTKQDWKIDATDSEVGANTPKVPMAWNRPEPEVAWHYPPQSVEFLPRILYFNGWNADYSVRFGVPGSDSTITNKALPQLQFGDIEEGSLSFVTIENQGNTYEGLVKKYYSTTLKTLKEGKKRRCFVNLTAKDIAELNFRKPIFIRSHTDTDYWIINKIIDYNPSNNESTEVELITYIDDAPSEVTEEITEGRPIVRNYPGIDLDYEGGKAGVGGGLGSINPGIGGSLNDHEDGTQGDVVSWEINNNGRNYTKPNAGIVNLSSDGGVALADGQTVMGQFNEHDPDAFFIVGAGTGDNDRVNGFSVATASGDYGQEYYYFKMDGASVNATSSRQNALYLTNTESPYTLSGTESFVVVDNSAGGDIDITLADPTVFKPEILTIKDEGGTGGAGVTINAPSGVVFDGNPSKTLSSNYEAVHIYAANGNYYTR